jgi:hypothetical protein
MLEDLTARNLLWLDSLFRDSLIDEAMLERLEEELHYRVEAAALPLLIEVRAALHDLHGAPPAAG